MIDNNKPYKEFTLKEKVDVAFYCLHQLFSYCLMVEDPELTDSLNEFEINKNPFFVFKQKKDLLRKIDVNKNDINKLKELNMDTVELLDNISLEINNKYRSILMDDKRMDIYDRNAFKLFDLKMD